VLFRSPQGSTGPHFHFEIRSNASETVGPGYSLNANGWTDPSDFLDANPDSLHFEWAKRMGGTGGDIGSGIAVDASGNVYTIGSFQGTADFDPGTGTANLTSAGGYDVFLSKISLDQVSTAGGTVTANVTPEVIVDGERLELTAPAGGSDYRWKKDGVFLADGGNISGALTRVLVIDPLALTDSGVYSCQYENGVARSVVETDGFIVTVLAVASLPIAAFFLLLMFFAITIIGQTTKRA